jgi:hypothetical protein
MRDTTRGQIAAMVMVLLGLAALLVSLGAVLLEWDSVPAGKAGIVASLLIASGIVTNRSQERRIKAKGHR